jgi:hypothetical protein
VPILDASFAYVAAERMGAWLFAVFLEPLRTGAYRADELPQRLRGDVLSVFHHEPTGGAVTFWRLRLGSVAHADFALSEAARLLPAARSHSLNNGDLVIIAASSAATLEAAPIGLEYQPIPPAAPAAAPLAARLGHGCVEPPR